MHVWLRRIWSVSFGVAAVVAGAWSAAAQCPMCKGAIEGSSDAGAIVSGVNLAVVVLLVPPVAIFTGVIVFVIKHRNTPH